MTTQFANLSYGGDPWAGSATVPKGGAGGRSLLAEGGMLYGLSNFGDYLKKKATGPGMTALGETLKEAVGGVPGTAKGALKGAGGVTKGLVSGIAPKAYQEAITRGAEAQRAARLAGLGKDAIKVAGMKPGIKIAGRYIGRRVPFLGAGLDLAAGDPLGAPGTLAGGAIGSLIAPGVGTVIGSMAGDPLGATGTLIGGAVGSLAGPWGTAIGSMVGGPILKGGRQILSPVFGDPNDPLSGRDWNLWGMPVTPYAKTKRSMEKQIGLYRDIQMPLIEEIQNAQLAREMKMAKLGMMQNMLSETNRLMSNAYSASPY